MYEVSYVEIICSILPSDIDYSNLILIAMTPLDNFYNAQKEPIKSCFLALKEIILSQDRSVTNEWKYGGSFFCYKGKMFCYLWIHKKLQQPYIGFVEGKKIDHPSLQLENRSRIKIMLLNPDEDLPIATISYLLQKAIGFYKSGEIKIK
jgi:hypothetical protein